jgi:hypothetical protein
LGLNADELANVGADAPNVAVATVGVRFTKNPGVCPDRLAVATGTATVTT